VRTLAGIEIHRKDKIMNATNHGGSEGDA